MVLFDMIAEAALPDLKSYGMSDVLIDLLRKVLAKDPADRAGVGDCLQHQFCAIAREQRIRELGDDIEKHDKKIVPQQRDLRQVSGCECPWNVWKVCVLKVLWIKAHKFSLCFPRLSQQQSDHLHVTLHWNLVRGYLLLDNISQQVADRSLEKIHTRMRCIPQDGVRDKGSH